MSVDHRRSGVPRGAIEMNTRRNVVHAVDGDRASLRDLRQLGRPVRAESFNLDRRIDVAGKRLAATSISG